eukprot:TRINITY_DN17216_c1_g1_i1.p1 TRINITY_DN17216_c1_g1~~TRINITY_DN17216_c1_g1_i1.p1  ORF type:complete len:373 (+),score=60.45 TRINITY_DN17216_c1_g1_i1:48-1121(+)
MKLPEEIKHDKDKYEVVSEHDRKGVIFFLAKDMKTKELIAGSAHPKEGNVDVELNLAQDISSPCCSSFSVDFDDDTYHYILSVVKSHQLLSDASIKASDIPLIFAHLIESVNHIHRLGYTHGSLTLDSFMYSDKGPVAQLSEFTTAQKLVNPKVDAKSLYKCLQGLYKLAKSKPPTSSEILSKATTLEEYVFSDYYREEVYGKLRCRISILPPATSKEMWQVRTYFGKSEDDLILSHECQYDKLPKTAMDALTALRYPYECPASTTTTTTTTTTTKSKATPPPSTSHIKRLKVEPAPGLSGEDSALIWKIAKQLCAGESDWKDLKKMRPDSFYESAEVKSLMTDALMMAQASTACSG